MRPVCSENRCASLDGDSATTRAREATVCGAEGSAAISAWTCLTRGSPPPGRRAAAVASSSTSSTAPMTSSRASAAAATTGWTGWEGEAGAPCPDHLASAPARRSACSTRS
ncbi:hypothetical protein ACFQGX_48475 [Nonomuraea dietziae]|uniref:hypothetical protein n=1 Tax=Nonomuraea dietziae TaxID=65515 RepID=UPI0036148B6F